MKKTAENLESLAHEAEDALILINHLILTKTGKSLTALQVAALRAAWTNQTCKEVGKEHESTESSIANAASLLWEQLSCVTKQKVTKKNFRVVLEGMIQSSSLPKSNSPENPLARVLTLDSMEQTDNNFLKANPAVKKNDIASLKGREILLQLSIAPERIGSTLYVERAWIENSCYRTIEEEGGVVRLKAPKEMGKTTIIERLVNYARLQGYRTVFLSFDSIELETLSNLNIFFKQFCFYVTKELQLLNRIADYWDEEFSGSKMNCTYYFRDYILAESESPLLLVLDDVDQIFESIKVSNEFFGLLRTWHQNARKGADRGIWKKIRLVLSYSTEAYLVQDINQSPFNVGLGIELPEFSPEEVLELARRYHLKWELTEVARLMEMIGGHPYLVRIALECIANQIMTLDELLVFAVSENGPFINHLRRHLINLEQQPHLFKVFVLVLEAQESIFLNSKERFQLHGTGLIRFEKDNRASIRCQLYRLYFQENFQRQTSR